MAKSKNTSKSISRQALNRANTPSGEPQSKDNVISGTLSSIVDEIKKLNEAEAESIKTNKAIGTTIETSNLLNHMNDMMSIVAGAMVGDNAADKKGYSSLKSLIKKETAVLDMTQKLGKVLKIDFNKFFQDIVKATQEGQKEIISSIENGSNDIVDILHNLKFPESKGDSLDPNIAAISDTITDILKNVNDTKLTLDSILKEVSKGTADSSVSNINFDVDSFLDELVKRKLQMETISIDGKISVDGIDTKSLNELLKNAGNSSKLNMVEKTLGGIVSLFQMLGTKELLSSTKNSEKTIKSMSSLLGKGGQLQSLLTNIKELQVEANKNSKDITSSIGELLNSIIGLGNLDKEGLKKMKSNLRELDWMTRKDDVLTGMGVWSKGLIYRIIKNIVDICDEAKTSKGKVKQIVNFLDSVVKLGTSIDPKEMKEFRNGLYQLYSIYGPDGLFWDFTKGLNGHDDEILAANVALSFLSNNDGDGIFDKLEDIANFQYKDAMNIFTAVQGLSLMGKEMNKLQENWDDVEKDRLDKIKTDNIIPLKELIKELASTDVKRFEEANLVLLGMLGVELQMIPIAKLAKKSIENSTTISEFLEHLDTVITYIGALENIDAKSKDNLKNVNKSLLELGNVALTTILAGSVTNIKSAESIVKYINQGLIPIIEAVNNINGFDKETGEKLKSLGDGFNSIVSLSVKAAICIPFVSLGSVGINLIKDEFLPSISDLYNVVTGLTSKVDKKELDKFKDIDSVILSILGTATLVSLGLPMILSGWVGLQMLNQDVKIIAKIVENISEVGTIDDVKKFQQIDKAIFELIGVTSLAAIATPALMMGAIGLGLILVEIPIIQKIVEGLTDISIDKKDMESMENVGKLIVGSMGIMITAGLLGMWMLTLLPAITAFTAIFSGFVFSITWVWKKSANGLEDHLETAKTFTMLVAVSALSLIIGAKSMTSARDYLNALLFTVTLGVFILGISAAYKGADWILKNHQGIKDAQEIAMIVAASGVIMLAGAMFMMIPGLWQGAMAFTLTLAGFIFGISATYAVASKMLKGKALFEAETLQQLIITSAATLLIGGLFMFIPGMALATLEFGAILAGFIAITSLSFAFASKMMNTKCVAGMVLLNILIALSTVCLLGAGYVIQQNPDMPGNILEFLGLLGLTIAGMGAAIFLLGSMKLSMILKGGATLLGIIWLIEKATTMFSKINEVAQMVNGKWDDIDKTLERMVWAISGTAVIAGVLGGIATAGGGVGAIVLASGGAVMLGIIGLIDYAGKAMKGIAETMLMFKQVEDADLDFEKVGTAIESYVGLVTKLAPLANPLVAGYITSAAYTSWQLGNAMSGICKGLQSYANLSIPEYGETGKVVGHREMDESDFQAAADNISLIVTTLGGTILQLYKDNPEIFDAGLIGNFLGMDTPFSRVVKSCTGLGKMIAKIAEGVKDMAELKVPIYKGTDKVGYRSLTKKDFDSAAENTNTIITTLGYAVLDIYKENPDIFDAGWFGNMIGQKTPFGRVVTATTKLGHMISGIAKGVKDMAELRVPIYDKHGKEVGSRSLGTADFVNAAVNTQLIVSCLGNSILALGTNPKTSWMFTDASLWGAISGGSGGGTQFGRIVSALRGIGGLISEVAKGVRDAADLRFQKYGTNGKILKDQYEHIQPADLGVNGKVGKSIQAMFSSIPEAVMSVYKEHPDWFEDGWFSDGPFVKIKKALDGLNKIVDLNVKSIKSILDVKLPNGSITRMKSIVMNMVQAIPQAFEQACFEKGKLKDVYDDTDRFENIKKAFKIYTDILSDVVSDYKKVNSLIKDLGKETTQQDLSNNISNMVSAIPDAFEKAWLTNTVIFSLKKEELKQIEDSFEVYTDIVNSLSKTYHKIQDIQEDLTKASKMSFEDAVIYSNKGIQKMLSSVGYIQQIPDSVFEILSKNFENNIETYVNGIRKLLKLYNDAPEEYTKYENVIKAIKGINAEIASVANTQNFKVETEDVTRFTTALNNLDIHKTNRFTGLVESLNNLAIKLGGLDRFTNVLSDKLSTVLQNLTQELRRSEMTIKKADEVQKKRHAAIKESINIIKEVLAKPMELSVRQIEDSTQVPQDNHKDLGGDSPTPTNDDNRNDTTPGSGGGNYTDLGGGSSSSDDTSTDNTSKKDTKKQTKPTTSGKKVSTNKSARSTQISKTKK